jgi:hypothetical protein
MRSRVTAPPQFPASGFKFGRSGRRRRAARTAGAAIECIREAHSSSSAIFFFDLPAFAHSLLSKETMLHGSVGTPTERWLEIQRKVRLAIKKLERAIAVLEKRAEVHAGRRTRTWLDLRGYLTAKRNALAALANVPLPPNLQKSANDLLELCRVMDTWSQQRVDLSDAMRVRNGEPPINDDYGGQWNDHGFWSRLWAYLSHAWSP